MLITENNVNNAKRAIQQFESLRREIEIGLKLINGNISRFHVEKYESNGKFEFSYSSLTFLLNEDEFETLKEVNLSLMRAFVAKRQNEIKTISFPNPE